MCARDLQAAVETSLTEAVLHLLVGHSFGGKVALTYVLDIHVLPCLVCVCVSLVSVHSLSPLAVSLPPYRVNVSVYIYPYPPVLSS